MIFSRLFRIDDVIHVEDVDVVGIPQMYDPDELLYVGYDVTVDG